MRYYGKRYYDPSNGRFVGRDPKMEAGGLNLYGFCLNDGINRWDYLGMDNWFTQGEAEAAAAFYGCSLAEAAAFLANPSDYPDGPLGLVAGVAAFQMLQGLTQTAVNSGANYVTGMNATNDGYDAAFAASAWRPPVSGASGSGWSLNMPAGSQPTPLSNNTISSIEFFGDYIVVRDQNGNTVSSYSASSGLPGVYDPSIPFQGPIPVGMYSLDPREISAGNFLRDLTGDWGAYRAPLTPYIGTDTLNRDNFFLHGGVTPGSAGCIDVGRFDVVLFPSLAQQPYPILIVVHPTVTPPGGG